MTEFFTTENEQSVAVFSEDSTFSVLSDLVPSTEIFEVEQSDTDDNVVELVIESLEPVQFEDPIELIDLLNFASLPSPEILDIQFSPEPTGQPQIALEIAAIIPQLEKEDSQYVMETLAEIINLVNDIIVLREATHEAHDSELVLQELCDQLLDFLQIEYGPEQFEQFINSLIIMHEHRKENQALNHLDPKVAFTLDNGTHEAKYLTRLLGYSHDTQERLHQLLGVFALRIAKLPIV